MKNVQLIEQKTGRIAASIRITLRGQNYTPMAQEYEAEAWKCAIEVRLVEPKRKADYSFSIAEAPLKL
jgi:hypothetical protein